MSQLEKKAGLLRRTSSSKKPLKEKVVLMYDEIFAKEDPAKNNSRFWDELFLMKVNLEYLEAKLESLDGDEVMKIKDNINSLFHHCVQALTEEHQIKVVNALQTLCALFRGVHQKNKSASGFDIINMLVGFDKAELRMKDLMESLDSLLCGEGSESLKALCLKLLLCLVTVTDNISQNTILEYVMINSIFEAILQILSDVSTRGQHGYDAVVLLALLVNYRKYESVNPYIVKLSIVDDEPTLDVSIHVDVVGSMFIADADEKLSVQTNEAILLALYEATTSTVARNKTTSTVARNKTTWNKTISTVARNKTTSAVARNKTNSTVARNKTTFTVARNKTISTVARNKTTSTVARNKTTTTVARNKTTTTVARNKTTSTVARNKTTSTVARNKTTTTVARNKTTSTVARNKTTSTVARNKTTTTVARNNFFFYFTFFSIFSCFRSGEVKLLFIETKCILFKKYILALRQRS
uniref:Uncharacterized protein n=1 Tax=Oncorhynchus tshawytscha TaxID=74940 RepID=A0AAZ3PYA4_ONCTS